MKLYDPEGNLYSDEDVEAMPPRQREALRQEQASARLFAKLRKRKAEKERRAVVEKEKYLDADIPDLPKKPGRPKKDSVRTPKDDYHMVYLLKEEGEKNYKIGRTRTDINSRLHGLQTGNPREIQVVATSKDITYRQAQKLEKALHVKYIVRTIRGEWFRLTDKDVEDIVRQLEHGFEDNWFT